jgi:dihydroorotate dehydrogenase electron transfer subunit
MHTTKGHVVELILEGDSHYLRIACPSNLIPAPGQYLLAGDASNAPLPVSLFYTDSAPQGFIAAASTAVSWKPAQQLYVRGPLGRGFALPFSARKIGLIAWDTSPARLKGLIGPALAQQDAAVVLVCDCDADGLPDAVEVQPMSALQDILGWADYIAADVKREELHELRQQLGRLNQLPAGAAGQVLIHTPVPCRGIADCGVCAVTVKGAWKLACQDGPVFDWRELE